MAQYSENKYSKFDSDFSEHIVIKIANKFPNVQTFVPPLIATAMCNQLNPNQ